MGRSSTSKMGTTRVVTLTKDARDSALIAPIQYPSASLLSEAPLCVCPVDVCRLAGYARVCREPLLSVHVATCRN
jgi:hypothetical protein